MRLVSLLHLTCLLSVFHFVSCKSQKPSSKLTEFRDAVQTDVERLSIKLKILDSLGISYFVNRQLFQSREYFAENLEIYLEDFNEKQCLVLAAYLKSHNEICTHKFSGPVNLNLFFPPMVQALVGKSFQEEYTLKNQNILGNCWGTTFELLRTSGLGPVYIFFTKGANILPFLTDNRYSTEVLVAYDSQGLKNLGDQIRPGDYLLVRDKSSGRLAHTAYFLTERLIFEKLSTSSYPYHIVELPSILRQYPSGVDFEVRRPRQSMTELPNPQNLLDKDHTYLEIQFEGSSSEGWHLKEIRN